jgi:protein N-terminal amidase
LKHDCVVTVGYPEKATVGPNWPTAPEYYNSAITVNREGETIANYRKSFLYYTDEKWALEGPDGFFDGEIPGLGNVAMGICKWPTKSFERKIPDSIIQAVADIHCVGMDLK